ncbi:MAG: ehmt2 [Chlamydiales bacterium]|jgi:ankyrin repeat protein|nr:ehmt2 [Chlamydiales bacterium]
MDISSNYSSSPYPQFPLLGRESRGYPEFYQKFLTFCQWSNYLGAGALLKSRGKEDPAFDPISFLFRQRQYQLIQFLIDTPPHHMNALSHEEMQHLFCWALIEGQEEIMELAGAKIDLNAPFPMSPGLEQALCNISESILPLPKNDLLYLAISLNHQKGADWLMRQGADINSRSNTWLTPLHHACFKGTFEIAQKLIQAGANLNAKDQIGAAPLYHACVNDHQKIVHLLLSSKAYVDNPIDKGATSLHVACQLGHLKIVQLLLQAGANIEARNEKGYTPLYYATSRGHLDTVIFLLSLNANANCQIQGGATPLHLACQIGSVAIARQLMLAGASLMIKNEHGMTPMDLAAAHGQQEMIHYLLSTTSLGQGEFKSPLTFIPTNADATRLLLKKKGLFEQGLDWQACFLQALKLKVEGIGRSPHLQLEEGELDLIFNDIAAHQINPNSVFSERQHISLLKMAYLLGKKMHRPYAEKLIAQGASWLEAVQAEAPLRPQSALFTLLKDFSDLRSPHFKERRELYQRILLDIEEKTALPVSWKVQLLAYLAKPELPYEKIDELLTFYGQESPLPFLQTVLEGKENFLPYIKIIKCAFAEMDQQLLELPPKLEAFKAALSSSSDQKDQLLEAKRQVLEAFPVKRKYEEAPSKPVPNPDETKTFAKGSFPSFERGLQEWLQNLSFAEADLALERHSEQMELFIQQSLTQCPPGIDINQLYNRTAKKYLPLFLKHRALNRRPQDPDSPNLGSDLFKKRSTTNTKDNLKMRVLALIQDSLKERLGPKKCWIENTPLETLFEIEAKDRERSPALGAFKNPQAAKRPRLYHIIEGVKEKTKPLLKEPLPLASSPFMSRQEAEQIRAKDQKRERLKQWYMKQRLPDLEKLIQEPLDESKRAILQKVIEKKKEARRRLEQNPLLKLRRGD